MKKQILLIIFSLLLGAGAVIAQPQELWNNTYGGGSTERAYSVVQTPDGGYAIAGVTQSFGAGNSDFYLVRTDAAGAEIWSNTFGGAGTDECFSMIQTSDGGFALAGYTSTGAAGNDDFWVVKTDANGNELWNQYYGSAVWDQCYSIIETTNGGLALGGWTSTGGEDFLLVLTNSDGSAPQYRNYGGNGSERCMSVVQAPDGDFVLGGWTNSIGAGNLDFWVVKTDANHNTIWSNSFGGNNVEQVMKVINTTDGGLALVGTTQSFGAGSVDGWLVKTDANGNSAWSQTFGAVQQDIVASFLQTPGGEYYISGVSNSNIGNTWEAWLVKADANGGAIWTQTFGAGGNDEGNTVIQTADGGLALAGSTDSFGAGGRDFWLIKLDSEGSPFGGFTETDDNNTLLVTAAHYNNTPVPTGWEIGVFTPGNVLSGSGIWTDGQNLGIAAFGDDNLTQAIEGFVAGETMNFRLWDNTANVEHVTSAVVSQGSIIWAVDGATVLSLEGYDIYTMNINLSNSWNLISVNVVPPPQYWTGAQGPDVVNMMAQFGNHLILMKDEHGHFYWPAFNYSNIGFWNLTEGYQVKMDQAMQGSWTGALIPANADIPISLGWNMIAYFPTYDLSAAAAGGYYALSDVIQNVILAKDRNGHFLSPSSNFSNMPRWHESLGYQIKVDANVVLNYPVQNDNIQSIPSEMSEGNNAHWNEPMSTGANMSLLIKSIEGVSVQNGDQIAAINANGNIVGVGAIQSGQCGIAVWGDDVSTDAVDGLTSGEAFTLRHFSSAKNAETVLISEGSLSYEADGFTAVAAITAAAVPETFFMAQSYPNPFNSTTRLAFGLPEAAHVAMQVFDMNGRLVATLADADFEAGNHSAVWNADASPAGLYLVKMQVGSFSDVRKLTLVK